MEDSEDGQRPRWSGCFWPSSTDMTIGGHPYRCECSMPQKKNHENIVLFKKNGDFKIEEIKVDFLKNALAF